MTKILLIDDDALLLRMYKSKFDEDGYDVEVATDGDMGLKKARENNPDLVLLDIMMPGINGLEVLKKLKESDGTKNIPVIILTNVGGSEDDVERGLSLGAVAYLVKASYTSKQVIQKIKEVLSGYVREVPKVIVPIKDETSDAQKRALDEVEKAKMNLDAARKKAEEVS